MPVQVRQDGYWEAYYGAPWLGLNTMQPENQLPDGYVPAVSDFMFRNDELRSRPAFNPTFVAGPPVSNHIVALIPSPGGAVGLLALQGGTNTTAYVLVNTLTPPWTASAQLTSMGNFMVSWRVFNGIAYFTGTQLGVNSQTDTWNGAGALLTLNVASSGGSNLGAVYLDELDNHLVMANVQNGAANFFPNRVWWSASGLPTVWDPSVNINAGFADFQEVPDQINGLMMLGRVGYILRNNGITEMAPTGNGQAPFDFNHLWASQYGIGNVMGFGYAQYGTTGVIISSEQIYAITSYELNPIGGYARDAIMADLSAKLTFQLGVASQIPVIGTIVPYLRSGLLPITSAGSPLNQGQSSLATNSFPYFAYMLFIPQPTGQKIWVFDFDKKNWTSFFIPNYWVTARPTLAQVPDVTAGAVTVNMLLPMAAVTTAASQTSTFLGTFDPTSFNDTSQGSSITFKTEDIVPVRVPTVRRVALVYRDLGQATITVSITNTDDNGVVNTFTSAPVALGNVVATGKL